MSHEYPKSSVFVSDRHGGARGSAPSTPNQHPYAIKTTSTAILTRSNSSGYAAHTRHAYIPITSSPSSRHRHSKSDLSRPAPRPLPIPPSLDIPSKDHKGHHHTSSEDLLFPTHRARRSDTLPAVPTLPPPSPVKVDDLPSNPRAWTTSQLSSYLITALRVKSGESLPLPLPVAKDIAVFVKEARLNGRAFLRLNEQDIDSMGINSLWRDALLNASRNLRQNVLKGRIWGFGSDDTCENTFNSPYKHPSYNSSSSSIEEASDSQDTTPSKDGGRKGRVRSLVASLERTSSSGSGFSNHGSSTSEGDIVVGAWADDEAAFASGSEASDVEDRKARDITKKRIALEPIVPPVNVLPEIPGEVEVASPEAEPSVEELLASSSLSHSWGARAWEDIDMNAGETVKHISPDNQCTDSEAHPEHQTQPGESSRSGSGKGSNKSAGRGGEVRMQIKDIFSRPLPSRPLPTPPKSGTSSPRLQNPVSEASMQLTEKLNQGVQVDVLPPTDVERVALDTEASEAESEKLRQAMSLLDLFRVRLAEVEKKLYDLERKDAEEAEVAHHSKAVETDVIATPTPLTEGSLAKAEGVLVEPQRGSILLTKSVQAESAGNTPERPSASGLALQPTNADAIDSTRPHNPHTSRNDWREYFGRNEWDPLENGIPSYVLMVGVGVCAVVLSTILKRMGGKKS
ncbi:hypothetical protein M0805_009809 [Coniferiporia weirii]|nr:hypothetical protein M0805_009809 [Coniferiporia weirii]